MQKLQKAARNNQHVVRLLVIMVCWLIFMAITRFQKFYTFLNFQTIASQFPEFGLMSLGVMLCMITGGIDLSCVGVANLTSILMAMLMTKLAGGADASLGGGWFPVIFLLAMAIGALCGLFSGFLVSRIRIPPILATLGVNELLSGVCIVLTDGAAYSSFPKDMTNALSANIGGVVPVRLLVFIVAAVAVWFMLERTTYGLKLHLLGTSEKVAVYSGLKTNRLLLRTYMTSGILSSQDRKSVV